MTSFISGAPPPKKNHGSAPVQYSFIAMVCLYSGADLSRGSLKLLFYLSGNVKHDAKHPANAVSLGNDGLRKDLWFRNRTKTDRKRQYTKQDGPKIHEPHLD